MHPQIRQGEPGKCPICGMDLIPVETGAGNDDPLQIKMSPTAMQLAGVQTGTVGREKPFREIRLTGKVKVDEQMVFSQASHIPGRIEKLNVSFTGERVSKGQVLAHVYSPELVTAQEELFEAAEMLEFQPALFESAKKKLLNWKLTERQISSIVEKGEPQETFPILADVSGFVTNKRVNLGDYIQRGQSLLEVADMSKVWAVFDVYEKDLPWINLGDSIAFQTNSIPGEEFKGAISFIDPVIDPRTRVASARIELRNPSGRLKPEMFLIGASKSRLEEEVEEITVPKSAVLWTGTRSLVYVKEQDAEGMGFRMREVVLGPGLGDRYVIQDGLSVGEEIAVHGTFSIDAAAQLAGLPSMMNVVEEEAMSHDHSSSMEDGQGQLLTAEPMAISKQAKAELEDLLVVYMALKNALVASESERAANSVSELRALLPKIGLAKLEPEAMPLWEAFEKGVGPPLDKMSATKNLEDLRIHFKPLSIQFIALVKTFGPFEVPLFIQHCPMADQDRGADWISVDTEIMNPYFGDMMLHCGEVTSEIK